MHWSTAPPSWRLQSLQWAPRKLAFALARVYTRLLDLGIPRLRRVARRNLAMALPEFTPQRHAQIVDGVFRSIARILVTFAKFPAIRRGYLEQWIRLEGGEYFDQARRPAAACWWPPRTSATGS
jgi:KDO2-lipid IV(A) lauroyltransferase